MHGIGQLDRGGFRCPSSRQLFGQRTTLALSFGLGHALLEFLTPGDRRIGTLFQLRRQAGQGLQQGDRIKKTFIIQMDGFAIIADNALQNMLLLRKCTNVSVSA